MITAAVLIERLNLKPHPEGGFYTETYRADELVSAGSLPSRYRGARAFGTAIYYLLVPGTCSSIHRIQSDEIFHFYLGDPVDMLLLFPGGEGKTVTLGYDLEGGMMPQVVVPRGAWQGAMLKEGGGWALMGTTVAPGFDFNDFETGARDMLVDSYPRFKEQIFRLTR
jgi:predicted cupin superfamily sugar epimerase